MTMLDNWNIMYQQLNLLGLYAICVMKILNFCIIAHMIMAKLL